MAIVRKTISLTEEQDAWVKEKVSSGEFSNDSEVLRAIVKSGMAQEEYKKAVLSKIQSGRDSGYSETSFNEIISKGRQRAISDLEKRQIGAA